MSSESEVRPTSEYPSVDLSDLTSEVQEESDLDKIIKRLLAPENIHHLTELSGEEITAFSTLHSIAEEYNLEILKKWLLRNLQLRVSKGRSGRKEFVQISRRTQDFPQERQGNFWSSFRRE